jgi:hypothetical protein
MFEFFAIVSIIPALIIAPGWLLARRWHAQSLWLLALPAAGILFWFLLVYIHIGAQSLANFVEIFIIDFVVIVASYLKFFLFDRRENMRSRGATWTVAVVAIIIISLRLFMPSLPE